mmetsp:Transcript_77787/g.207816  ORF Transcript_77787/g.207816 Transcript_77787/m.207816 type:complete len:203 (+) Transcript_77787:97-705(+)
MVVHSFRDTSAASRSAAVLAPFALALASKSRSSCSTSPFFSTFCTCVFSTVSPASILRQIASISRSFFLIFMIPFSSVFRGSQITGLVKSSRSHFAWSTGGCAGLGGGCGTAGAGCTGTGAAFGFGLALGFAFATGFSVTLSNTCFGAEVQATLDKNSCEDIGFSAVFSGTTPRVGNDPTSRDLGMLGTEAPSSGNASAKLG